MSVRGPAAVATTKPIARSSIPTAPSRGTSTADSARALVVSISPIRTPMTLPAPSRIGVPSTGSSPIALHSVADTGSEKRNSLLDHMNVVLASSRTAPLRMLTRCSSGAFGSSGTWLSSSPVSIVIELPSTSVANCRSSVANRPSMEKRLSVDSETNTPTSSEVGDQPSIVTPGICCSAAMEIATGTVILTSPSAVIRMLISEVGTDAGGSIGAGSVSTTTGPPRTPVALTGANARPMAARTQAEMSARTNVDHALRAPRRMLRAVWGSQSHGDNDKCSHEQGGCSAR